MDIRWIIVFGCILICGAAEQVSIEISNTKVNVGDDVIVICNVTGSSIATTLFWYKVKDGLEVQMATKATLNDVFQDTGRYSLQQQVDTVVVRFTLTITGVQPEDSGIFICHVPGSPEKATSDELVVYKGVKDVHLYSLATAGTHEEQAEELSDGQQIRMEEGEQYFFKCTTSGSNPAPEMDLTLGDTNVNDLFDTSDSADTIGGKPGLQQVLHTKTMVSKEAITITNKMNAYEFRCTAKVGDTLPLSVAVAPLLHFAPEVECPQVVKVPLYTDHVKITCKTKSNPAITDATIRWLVKPRKETPGYNTTLSLSEPSDGHYELQHSPGAVSDEHTVTLHIDKVYPQMFRTYFVVATNEIGQTETAIKVIEDKKSSRPISGSLHMTSPVLSLVLTICLSLVLHL